MNLVQELIKALFAFAVLVTLLALGVYSTNAPGAQDPVGTAVITLDGGGGGCGTLGTGERCHSIAVTSNPSGMKDGATATVANLNAVLLTNTPTSCTPSGVAIFMAGGGGNSLWRQAFPNWTTGLLVALRAACITSVQVAWNSSVYTGTAGIVANLNRVGALIQAVCADSTIRVSGVWCGAAGQSGGGGQLAYCLSFTTCRDVLDVAVLSATAIAHPRWGCSGTADTTWTAYVTAHSLKNQAGDVVGYSNGGDAGFLDTATGSNTCVNKTNGGGVDNVGYRDSATNGKYQLYFPNTECHFISGQLDGGPPDVLNRYYKTQIVACNGAITDDVVTGENHVGMPNSTAGMNLIASFFTAAAVGCTWGGAPPVTGCAGKHQP